MFKFARRKKGGGGDLVRASLNGEELCNYGNITRGGRRESAKGKANSTFVERKEVHRFKIRLSNW